jgi:hypothetical protein
MNVAEVLLGLGTVAASILALWIALPRDGQVRRWLRGETMQALYAVMVLSIFAFGVVYIVTGMVP